MTRADLEENVQPKSPSSGTEEFETDDSEEESIKMLPVPRIKNTFAYYTVQDRHALPEHQYIPRKSHGGVRVEPSAGLYPNSTHSLRAHFNSTTKRAPFDAAMVPVQYTECVSVATVPAHTEQSCVAYCDIEKPRRIKEGVQFREVLSPTSFENSIVVRTDCTKKNFKSLVNYWPKFRPRQFSETCYVLPKYVSRTYVAFVDYHVDKERKWFTTTVQLKPKTISDTTIHNFEMQEESELVDSDGEEIPTDSEDNFHVDITNIGERDINMNVYNKGVEFLDGEPPHQEVHRTHMLVNDKGQVTEVNGFSDSNGNFNDNKVEQYKSEFNRDHFTSVPNENGRYSSVYNSPRRSRWQHHDQSSDDEQITGPGHFDKHENYNVHNGYQNGYASDEVHL